MDVFVARQPVFNLKKNIFGYELLFRKGLENSFPNVDGDAATSNVISNMLLSFEMKDILGNKFGLVNFTKNLILQKVALSLPKDIIIEVLEDIEPKDNIIHALKELSDNGFQIALDDFVYHNKFKPMIELCQIIKFDLIATPLDTLGPVVNDIKKNYNITLLAEKVETYDEFQQAREMGFTLFQGYFFSKPEVLSKKAITSNQISKLKLIKEVGKQELNMGRVEKLIKADVSASFKLLKLINSPYFKRVNPIDTVKDAITYLGTEKLRRFINVVVVSDLSEAKPNELMRSSIVRGRMCELCGAVLDTNFNTEELFTLGLFSYMDAILDRKMKTVLENFAISDNMKDALLGKNEAFNKLLEIVTSFSKGDWKSESIKSMLGTPIETKIYGFYCDSLKMVNSLFAE